MAHSIPDHYVLQATILHQEDGVDYEFAVTYTAFGEVISVVNHLLELPAEAQSLMLGKEAGKIVRRLQFHGERFRFFLPLVALQVVDGAPWETIRQAILEVQAKPAFQTMVLRDHFRDDWVYNLWILPPPKKTAELRWLKALLSEDMEVQDDALNVSSKDRTMLAAPILLHHLRFRTDAAYWKKIIRLLAEQENVNLRNFLSEVLADEVRHSMHLPALLGLSYYQDDALREQLFTYYQSHQSIAASARCYLVRALRGYRIDAIKDILLKELTSESRLVGEEAYTGLVEFGLSERELAAYLRSAFEERLSPEHLTNILVQYCKLQADELLPTPDEILDLLVGVNVQRKEVALNDAIIPLLQRQKTTEILPRLFDLIHQRQGTPIEAAVFDVLGGIGTEKALKVILFFLDEPTLVFREEARQAVRSIAQRHHSDEVKALLIQTLSNQDQKLKRIGISSLIAMLKETRSPDLIPILSTAVADESPALKKKFAEALPNEAETKNRYELLERKQNTKSPARRKDEGEKPTTGSGPGASTSRKRKASSVRWRMLTLCLLLILFVLILKFC